MSSIAPLLAIRQVAWWAGSLWLALSRREPGFKIGITGLSIHIRHLCQLTNAYTSTETIVFIYGQMYFVLGRTSA